MDRQYYYLNGIPLSKRTVALLHRCGMEWWSWNNLGSVYFAFSESEWAKMTSGTGGGK